MGKQSRLKDFLTIGAGTFINILISVLTTPIVTRLVDTTEYGQLSMFTTYSGIAVMIFCLGLDQSLIRYYYDRENVDYKSTLTRFTYCTASLIFVIGVIILLIGAKILGRKIYQDYAFFIPLVIFVFVQMTSRFGMLLLRVEYKSSLYAALNILHKLIYLVLVVAFYITVRREVTIDLLIFATITSTIMPAIISIISQKRIWFNKNTANINKIEILKYGLPFILSMGITTVFEALDRLSISHFCSYSEVGIYASAMSIIGIFAILQTTFNTLWSPMAIEQYNKDSSNYVFYRRINDIIVVLMFVFGITVILFKDIIILLLGTKYREADVILPFLIFHPIYYTISETTVIGVDFSRRSYLHILTALVACIVNGIGNYILVPKFQGQGAAISTGISYIVFFAIRSFFGLRYYNYKPHMSRITILTIITVIYAFETSFKAPVLMCISTYFILLSVIIVFYKDTVLLIIYKGKSLLNSVLKGRNTT